MKIITQDEADKYTYSDEYADYLVNNYMMNKDSMIEAMEQLLYFDDFLEYMDMKIEQGYE